MSEGNVAILNTKLDILIDDFKAFKQYSLGFLMAIAIPFAVYIVLQLSTAKVDIAVIQEKVQVLVSDKAIKEN